MSELATLPEFAAADFAGYVADLRREILDGLEVRFQANPELGGRDLQIGWQRAYVATVLFVASEVAVDAGVDEVKDAL
jgi:hypothetical protein